MHRKSLFAPFSNEKCIKEQERLYIVHHQMHRSTAKFSLFIGWWCLITSSFPHTVFTPFTSIFLCSFTSSRREYRKCICGYNNKIVNLRSHVIKVPTEKNRCRTVGGVREEEESGKSIATMWSYTTSNILVMQAFSFSLVLSLSYLVLNHTFSFT